MIFPNAWGAMNWLIPVCGLMLLASGVVVWTYMLPSTSRGLRVLLITLKVAAFALLAICLLEPLNRYDRPEPGANVLVVMADDSQSLQIKDLNQTETRATLLKQKLVEDTDWLDGLAENFDLRRYQFDRRLRPVSNFIDYDANENGSDILGNLKLVASRFSGRPSAGIVLLTDGNVTDANAGNLDAIDWQTMPPVYPVMMGKQRPAKDLGITNVITTQTNFETAPVSITAELMAHGYQGSRVVVQLLDENDEEIDRKTINRIEDGKRFAVRFKTRPENRGVNVFHINAFVEGQESNNETAESSREATIVNNVRTTIVNRGRGPFRILYVCGRPNWELKFLRRSIQDDPEIDLVALVRIAKRAAKFTFRGRSGQDSNPLFRGFESQDDDTTEQHDEPVFLRLGTRGSEELRGGFPKDAPTLFQYDAIVLDDLEAKFFTEDQKSLIQQFVSQRGGGLLMLGGQESFAGGEYDRTQIGEMLPVYLDRIASQPDSSYQLDLTREGWLQPWVRIESTEATERDRLSSMPKFMTLNHTNSIKPGATVLATVSSDDDKVMPALVVQNFGKGRTAALLIGDFWRWKMQSDEKNDDLGKAWRQMLRWLVADVPRRVQVDIDRMNDTNRTSVIRVRVHNEEFKPYDNASVKIEIRTPDGKSIELEGEPSGSEAGSYAARFVSTVPGAYRAVVHVYAADGSEIETRESGWVSDPDGDEFRSLEPNRELLEQIAKRSGGELLELEALDQFVKSLDSREVPIMETRTHPWWHHWSVFSFAIGLLVCEWGIRRWKGLP